MADTADLLEDVHRTICRGALGPLNIAIATRRLTSRQLADWAAALRRAADKLDRLAADRRTT